MQHDVIKRVADVIEHYFPSQLHLQTAHKTTKSALFTIIREVDYEQLSPSKREEYNEMCKLLTSVDEFFEKMEVAMFTNSTVN